MKTDKRETGIPRNLRESIQFSRQNPGCKITMTQDFTFTIKRSQFDENYNPAESTRITTNFANLARGQNRQENLRNTLTMMNNRFNNLAYWDNPKSDRYAVELDIISVEMRIEGSGAAFPVIEILQTHIVDKKTDERIEGIVGNNFSSYVRDYDFSVLLLDHNKNKAEFNIPENFGVLHGNIFKYFVNSREYQESFKKQPVICLSISNKDTYHRTGNQHPVLGIEYRQDRSSLTDQYFKKWACRCAISCRQTALRRWHFISPATYCVITLTWS